MSTVPATDALVLKYQVISIHSAEKSLLYYIGLILV